jgi:3-hydroxyacyl-[acyl-carrier-protein] dehydratase
VGQEKAVIAEEITLTFGFVEAADAPVPINGVGHADNVNVNGSVSAPPTPLRAAINA